MTIDMEKIINYHVLYMLLLLNTVFFPESVCSKGMLYTQINQIVCKYSSGRRSRDILKRPKSLSELFLLLLPYIVPPAKLVLLTDSEIINRNKKIFQYIAKLYFGSVLWQIEESDKEREAQSQRQWEERKEGKKEGKNRDDSTHIRKQCDRNTYTDTEREKSPRRAEKQAKTQKQITQEHLHLFLF